MYIYQRVNFYCNQNNKTLNERLKLSKYNYFIIVILYSNNEIQANVSVRFEKPIKLFKICIFKRQQLEQQTKSNYTIKKTWSQ